MEGPEISNDSVVSNESASIVSFEPGLLPDSDTNVDLAANYLFWLKYQKLDLPVNSGKNSAVNLHMSTCNIFGQNVKN